MNYTKMVLMFLLLFICLTQNGCSLLQAPLELAKAPFSLAGQALKFLGSLPKPPPGVIPGVF